MRVTRQARRGWLTGAIVLAGVVFGLSPSGIGSGAAAAGGGAQAGRTVTVGIVNFAYRPASLTIGKGSTVVFRNSSGTAHTATRGGSFTTGRIKAGRSASIRFGQRGTFAYHCTIHPFMKGKIVVD